jgi:hypothetical protein
MDCWKVDFLSHLVAASQHDALGTVQAVCRHAAALEAVHAVRSTLTGLHRCMFAPASAGAQLRPQQEVVQLLQHAARLQAAC